MLSSKNLREEQLKAVKFLVKRPNSLLLADPGAGKTTVGLHWIRAIKPKRTLIVSTKQICFHVWVQEAAKWKCGRNFTFTQLTGVPNKKRPPLILEDTDIHIINFQSLKSFVDLLANKNKKLCDLYEAIIFDESEFIKSSDSKLFKRIRNQVQKVRYTVGFTGTPLGNSMLDIWGQVYLCAGEKPLGSRYSYDKPSNSFRTRYFDSDYQGWNYTLKDGAYEKIVNRVLPYAYRLPIDPERQAKPPKYHRLKYTLPDDVLAEYNELKKDLFLEIDTNEGLFEIKGKAAVIQNKLRQIESGALYVDKDNWVEMHDRKIKWVRKLCKKMGNKQLLIFYEYEHEWIRLKRDIPDLTHIKSRNAVERWNAGDIQFMAAHPRSSGHGLNLHLSGAHNMLFFTLPWSLRIYKQANGRLDRTGQENIVNLYTFIGPPVETKIAMLLKSLRSLEDRFMDDIEARQKLIYTPSSDFEESAPKNFRHFRRGKR